MSSGERWLVLGLMGADLLVVWVAVRVSDRRARRVARDEPRLLTRQSPNNRLSTARQERQA